MSSELHYLECQACSAIFQIPAEQFVDRFIRCAECNARQQIRKTVDFMGKVHYSTHTPDVPSLKRSPREEMPPALGTIIEHRPQPEQ